MRDDFAEYYTPTPAEFEGLWKEAIFVLDTSILQHIYEYGEATRELFFKILEKLCELGRLWIPYQVGKEYQEGRLGVISKQRGFYKDLMKKLAEASNGISRMMRKHHPLLDTPELTKRIQEVIDSTVHEVTNAQELHPDYYMDDPLHDRLTELLKGKVGKATTVEQLSKIYKEGEKRYELEIPPGFKDQNKGFPKKYGDYVIWRQMIEFAKETKKPIIFITDDETEDWWRLHGRRTIGPPS